jgi:hypothetical protein
LAHGWQWRPGAWPHHRFIVHWSYPRLRVLWKCLAGAGSVVVGVWMGWNGFWMASHTHTHQTFQSRVGEGLHFHSGFVLFGVHQGNLESYESYIYLWFMQPSKLYRHHFGLVFVAHWIHFPTPLILSLGQMACQCFERETQFILAISDSIPQTTASWSTSFAQVTFFQVDVIFSGFFT